MNFDYSDINEEALYILKTCNDGRFETAYIEINKDLLDGVNADAFYDSIRTKDSERQHNRSEEDSEVLKIKRQKIYDFYNDLYRTQPELFGFRNFCPGCTIRSSYMNFVGIHSPDEIDVKISDDGKSMRFHNPRSPIGSGGYDYSEITNYTRDFFDAYFIEETYNKCNKDESIKAFSNRQNGWTLHDYKLNDILSVEIATNFGYGSSSYFVTTLMYDDIKIIPFSRLVLYRFANTMELIRHTREYSVSDTSWELALDFIRDACNEYHDNGADSFIGNYVINECKTLTKLLPDYLQTNVFNLSEHKDGTYYYKKDKVHKVELNGFELFVFRGEKIAGATDFTDSIKKLGKLIPTQAYIDCIDDCCKRVIPQLLEASKELEAYMTSLSLEIDNKKKELSAKKDEKEKLEPIIENFNEEETKFKTIIFENCDKEKYSYYSSYVSELAKKELVNKFPDYTTLIEKNNGLRNEINVTKKRIEDLGDSIRQHYMYEVQIRKYKEKINGYIENMN